MIDRAWMGDQVAALMWHHGRKEVVPGSVILQWCEALKEFTEQQVYEGISEYLSVPVMPGVHPWPGQIKQRIIESSIMTPDKIVRYCAEVAEVPVDLICSDRRARFLAWPRMAGMSLACKHTDFSLPQIGRAFGGRDHTTVIHAKKTAPEKLSRPEFATPYYAIERKIMATNESA